jgi:hypothetical protein
MRNVMLPLAEVVVKGSAADYSLIENARCALLTPKEIIMPFWDR